MPLNKNALIRYRYLDELLSDKYHYYDIHDITNKVNDRLENDGFAPVVQRTIEKDLEFLTYSPFYAPIEHFPRDGRSIIRYNQVGYSIFTQKLSGEEKHLLREVLNTIGQFEGLTHFTWLNGLKHLLGVEKKSAIISFAVNPIANSNLIGKLFFAISNNQVIKLKYHKYNEGNKIIKVHPYLLKQYNNRWFLICADDIDGFILTFSLDRIDDVSECPDDKFKKCPVNLSLRFEHVVGVTVYNNSPIEDIIIWASNRGYNYIKSKPIHKSQTVLPEEEANKYRSENTHLRDGNVVKLRCIVNTELIQLIMSYTDELVVLAPQTLRNAIIEKILAQNHNYLL